LAEVAGQIVASADSIESSTHETTKAAESIATEAQGMAETATTLQQLVATFQLKNLNSEPEVKALGKGKSR
ncbi:MAG: hypothetical protein GX256_02275, partial [Fretibacterium sp.]|nr:hypothetical protein [Fretibacterium sp.]